MNLLQEDDIEKKSLGGQFLKVALLVGPVLDKDLIWVLTVLQIAAQFCVTATDTTKVESSSDRKVNF